MRSRFRSVLFRWLVGLVIVMAVVPLHAQPPAVLALPAHPIELQGLGMQDRFQRELLRQAVLLAARESFGLATRDAMLGEPVAEEGDELVFLLDYKLEAERGGPAHLSLMHGGQPTRTIGVGSQYGLMTQQHELLLACGAVSRGEAVQALRGMGFEPRLLPVIEDVGTLPDRLEAQLMDMDLPAQFFAVRELHRLLRTDGQRLEVLCGLARAYANLAQLTRFRLDHTDKALMARSLLYAERAAALFSDRPEPYWALMYGWMMYDLPDLALEQLITARSIGEATGAVRDEPGWVELLLMHVRYDDAALVERARAGGADAELAALLALSAAQTTALDGVRVRAIEAFNRVNPDSSRGYNLALLHNSFLGAWHYARETHYRLNEAIPRRLVTYLVQLPDTVVDAIGDAEQMQPRDLARTPATARIAWAMEDYVIGGADEPEPSLAVLGHLIEGAVVANVVHLGYQATFNSRDQGRYWPPIAAAVERDPNRQFLGLFAYSYQSPVPPRRELLAKVELGEMNLLVGERLFIAGPDGVQIAGLASNWAIEHARVQSAQNQFGLQALAGSTRTVSVAREQVNRLRDVATHSPYIHAWDIRAFAETEGQVLLTLRNYAENPDVLLAAADWYEQRGMLDEAYHMLWELSQRVSDKEQEVRTAEIGLRLGEEDIWLELMLRAAEHPDWLPPYYDIYAGIARTYIRARRWEQALRYADLVFQDQPRETDSMPTIALCLIGLDRADEAFDRLEAWDRRYGRDACLKLSIMLGLDDRRRHYGEAEGERLRTRFRNDLDQRELVAHDAWLAVLDGDDAPALDTFERAWQQWAEANDGARVAILSQKLGQPERRDRALRALADGRATDYRSQAIQMVANLILASAGPDRVPDDRAARELVAEAGFKPVRQNVELNLGWYLLVSGENERAIRHLRQVLDRDTGYILDYERVMAAALLRDAGYDMSEYRWTFKGAHAWPEDDAEMP